MRTAEHPRAFDEREKGAVHRGMARGDCAGTTAQRLGRRAADVARERIAMGLSEHEEFFGAVPLPVLSHELLSM